MRARCGRLCLFLLILAWSPPAAADPTRGPLLWRFESPAGSTYLFGTIHMGISADALDPSVHQAFAASSVMVAEADPHEALSLEFLGLALLPEGQSLDGMLSPPQWKTLIRLIGGLMPEPLLRRYQPWMVASLVLASSQPPGAEMDLQLLAEAGRSGKRIRFLEDMSHQVKLLTQAVTIENLVELLEDPEGSLSQVQRTLDAYRAGDHALLQAIMFEERENETYRKQFELLFDQRNREWLPHIEKYIEQGDVFIAVGAGHLLSERGLIELLRQAGHEPTHVPAR